VCVEHGLALVSGEVSQLDGEVAHRGSIGAGCCEEGADVWFDELVWEIATGAEVEKL